MKDIIEFKEPNRLGETMKLSISKCENQGGKNSLPYLWWKEHFTDHILENWWHVETYVYDKDGRCWAKYNPQHKKDGGKLTLNFKWLLETTEENRQLLLDEIERLFYAAEW